MADVCLVQMPYSGLYFPSIALGLLKAYLSAKGIDSSVLYANLLFADDIGVEVYRAIEETPTNSLIGEWTFASAAFPDFDSNEAQFLALLTDTSESCRSLQLLRRFHPNLDCRQLLSRVRRSTPDFVERVAKMVLENHPRIVGCSSSFQQHCSSLALLRRIKALAPDVITMLGGANCEGVMGRTTHREFEWVDFVMSGEVDDFFADFCATLLERGPDLAQLPDAVFGKADRSCATVAPLKVPRAVVKSLDETAIPDYDEYFEALRATAVGPHLRPALLFESSRGCWWGMKHHCTFCGLNGEGIVYRSKSPDRVVTEIDQLMARYGVSRLQGVDNIIDMRYLDTVFPALARREEPPFLFYEVKANLRREQIQALRAGGVVRIQPGIESMHDEVLKLLAKGNTWYVNVQLLKWAQEFGVEVSWNLLAGVPGESEDWYLETAQWLPLISHLQPPSSGRLSKIRYDRFSPYHNRPEQYGLALVPHRGYQYVYPLSPEALAHFAYFFEDANEHERQTAPQVRPGYGAVEKQLAEWCQVFFGTSGATRARLLAEDHGDRVTVRDTRPIAETTELVLDGVEWRVLKACDSARTREGLLTAVNDDGGPAASRVEIDSVLERLKELKLLLEWRGRLLSLPVNEPVMPYVENGGCGFTNLRSLLTREGRRSLARQCIRLPHDMPLTELFPASPCIHSH